MVDKAIKEHIYIYCAECIGAGDTVDAEGLPVVCPYCNGQGYFPWGFTSKE